MGERDKAEGLKITVKKLSVCPPVIYKEGLVCSSRVRVFSTPKVNMLPKPEELEDRA